MSMTKKNSKLIDFLDRVKLVDVDESLLSSKEILHLKFKKFMSDIDFKFDVFKSDELNNELVDKFYKTFFLKYFDMVVFGEPEYYWKMYFERIYLENIDRVNHELRLQLVELNNIEDKLYENVNMTNKFDEDVIFKEDQTKNVGETESVKRTTDTTDKSDKKSNSNSRDFTRDINEETPNGQLNITTNDGSGVITTATSIDETLETNKSDKTDHEDKTQNKKDIQDLKNDRDTKQHKSNDQNKDNLRVLKGYQNLGSKAKLLDDYQKLFNNTMQQFILCFDNLFKHVY